MVSCPWHGSVPTRRPTRSSSASAISRSSTSAVPATRTARALPPLAASSKAWTWHAQSMQCRPRDNPFALRSRSSGSNEWSDNMRYLMRQKIFELGDDFTISDEDGKDVFIVDGRAMSMGHKLSFQDMNGRQLAF